MAINPDPFRVRAQRMMDSGTLDAQGKALAGVVLVLCDRYDELRAVLGADAGEILHGFPDAP